MRTPCVPCAWPSGDGRAFASRGTQRVRFSEVKELGKKWGKKGAKKKEESEGAWGHLPDLLYKVARG